MARGAVEARRPRLALPFSVLVSPGTVRLVAGEDFRYTLAAPELDRWLPPLLSLLDGRRTQAEALIQVAPEYRPEAARLLDRLFGERVLVSGTAAEAHGAARYRVVVEGSGALGEGWDPGSASERPLSLLCQDRLDYGQALEFNRRCLDSAAPWMWASTGPMARAYVSPVFLSTSGPCLQCLIAHFRRRSPAPEILDALRAGGPSAHRAVPFPGEGVLILKSLIRQKVALLSESEPPVALYRLQVLELATLEITSHRVFLDPECEACRGRGR